MQFHTSILGLGLPSVALLSLSFLRSLDPSSDASLSLAGCWLGIGSRGIPIGKPRPRWVKKLALSPRPPPRTQREDAPPEKKGERKEAEEKKEGEKGNGEEERNKEHCGDRPTMDLALEEMEDHDRDGNNVRRIKN